MSEKPQRISGIIGWRSKSCQVSNRSKRERRQREQKRNPLKLPSSSSGLSAPPAEHLHPTHRPKTNLILETSSISSPPSLRRPPASDSAVFDSFVESCSIRFVCLFDLQFCPPPTPYSGSALLRTSSHETNKVERCEQKQDIRTLLRRKRSPLKHQSKRQLC